MIIQGMRERYSIEFTKDAALIGRPEIGMKPCGDWLLRGLVRLNNFGRQAEFVPWGRVFDVFGNGRDLRYKNGKPQWFVADVDHGTPRIIMEGVRCVYGDTNT
jgi:hypothetical protein